MVDKGRPLRLTHQLLGRHCQFLGVPTPKPEDLLAQIGYGKLSPRLVLDKIVPQEQLKEQAPEHPVVSAVKRVLRPGSEPDRIKVRGADDVMVFRAKCCNPIRGEKIVGYITRGKGVSVHSAKCANVVNLMYGPERRIDVEWDKGADIAPYTVALAIKWKIARVVLAEAGKVVSDINTNMTSGRQHGANPRRIDVTVESGSQPSSVLFLALLKRLNVERNRVKLESHTSICDAHVLWGLTTCTVDRAGSGAVKVFRIKRVHLRYSARSTMTGGPARD